MVLCYSVCCVSQPCLCDLVQSPVYVIKVILICVEMELILVKKVLTHMI